MKFWFILILFFWWKRFKIINKIDNNNYEIGIYVLNINDDKKNEEFKELLPINDDEIKVLENYLLN